MKFQKIKLPYILIFIFGISEASSQVYINEFQAYNASTYLEKWWGNFPDWIELYNGGDEPVNLSGYFITDDISQPERWELPSETIYPGDYKLIYADKLAYRTHTNFSLNGGGEQILLFTPDLELVDSISFGPQYTDISFGRYPDGTRNWFYFEACTPDGANSANRLAQARFSPGAKFSLNGGFYAGLQNIEITTSSPNAIIRYTNDGSDPTSESPICTGPISISSTTVLRAKVFEPGMFASPTTTQTYIFDKITNLPVISISTDWDYLWDGEVGIYVEGTNGITGNCSEVPVNYNQDWERPIHIEYFDQNGNPGFNQQAGTKIFGACSRRAEQKSLSIFAREKYGKGEFDVKLFEDKDIDQFKSFIIRNSGNDIRHTMLRDAMMQTLVKDRMDVDYQEYQPAVVYLNGAYWGILNIREKINEDYLEANHGIDPDSVDILLKHVEVVEGTDTHYQQMMNFIRSNDLSIPDNYRYVGRQMDIDQFMNYCIAQIYFLNQDWPQGNIKYWRPHTPDGRWRWLLYDLDFGFGFLSYNDDMIQWVTNSEEKSTELFRELLTSNEFRFEFLQRLCSHMNTSFLPGRVIGIIDSLASQIEPEMPAHIERFNWPHSMPEWQDELMILRDFASERYPVLINNLVKKFSLEGTCELTTNVHFSTFGKILVSGVEVPRTYAGAYFKNIPLRLNAIPKEGYVFLGWQGDTSSTDPELELTISANTSLTAHFGPAIPISDLHINELSSHSGNALRDEFGEMEDWIEIHNSGNEPVQLAGLYLTDSIEDLTKHMIPFGNADSTVIEPGGSIVLYADNDAAQGCLHLGFKLNNSGETVALVQQIKNHVVILDSVNYSSQSAGITAGRLPDGTGEWNQTQPTPGQSNTGLSTITGLRINEFSASNWHLEDDHGELDDWIEVHNNSDVAVNVGGLYLTDSLAHPTKYRIPSTHPDSTTIPPGGYLLLWADNQPGQGILHLGFGLKRTGEQIGLAQTNGADYIDSITYDEQFKASSLSRHPAQVETWLHMPPTPGSENLLKGITGVYINEFSTSNTSIIRDEYGEYDDWMEVYNANDEEVNLSGLYLTDSLGNGTRYRIPSTFPDSTSIPPGGHLLLWADNQPGQGVLHLGFGLKRSGEQIGLVHYDGSTVIDSNSYSEQYVNASLSRYPDGMNPWHHLPPTPGSENAFIQLSGLRITEFSASNNSFIADDHGEFDDWIEIHNETDKALDIGGLFITDSLSNGKKFRIPTTRSDSTTIPPKGYLILWADKQPGQGVLHLDFGLNRAGEQLGLLQYDGLEFIDSLTFGPQFVNASSSLYREGEEKWISVPSTPGEDNYRGTITGILINEFSASNLSFLKDDHGEFDDWIELYNMGEEPLDIGGLYVTDTLGNRRQFRIPTTNPDSTTIPPGGYLLLWADNQPEQGILHLGLGLKRSGEQIGMVMYDGTTLIDFLTFGEQYRNASMSRYPDGHGSWMQLPSTPGSLNRYNPVSGLYINEFSSSNRYLMQDNYGEYDDWIEIFNSNDEATDIGGLYITDTLADRTKYRIPTLAPDSTTIPPGGYLVLWADNQPEQGVLHLGFGLTREGEQIGLVQYNGLDFIDTLTFGEIMVNTSMSRFPDGHTTWLTMNSTPGNSNVKNEYERLYINEFRAGDPTLNSTTQYQDGNWIELFNHNDYGVNIGGLYLTDDLARPGKYRVPHTHPELTTIPPNGYLILWTDYRTDQGILHLNFQLEPEGTEIGLARNVLGRFFYVDTLVSAYQQANVSTGRVKDGVASWTNFTDPTPGWSNSNTLTLATDLAEGDFRVYPNPVSNGILHLSQSRNITLYNQMGRVEMEKTNVNRLNLEMLPPGLYILRTDQGDVVQVVIL